MTTEVRPSGHRELPAALRLVEEVRRRGRLGPGVLLPRRRHGPARGGKNMVRPIRHWALTARVIDSAPNDPRGLRGQHVTPLGAMLFGPEGVDPYLEDVQTLWLIHWLITTHSGASHDVALGLRGGGRQDFSRDELPRDLAAYAQGGRGRPRPPPARDAGGLLRTYLPKRASRAVPAGGRASTARSPSCASREGCIGRCEFARGTEAPLGEGGVPPRAPGVLERTAPTVTPPRPTPLLQRPGAPGRSSASTRLSPRAPPRRRRWRVARCGLYDDTAGLRQFLRRKRPEPIAWARPCATGHWARRDPPRDALQRGGASSVPSRWRRDAQRRDAAEGCASPPRRGPLRRIVEGARRRHRPRVVAHRPHGAGKSAFVVFLTQLIGPSPPTRRPPPCTNSAASTARSKDAAPSPTPRRFCPRACQRHIRSLLLPPTRSSAPSRCTTARKPPACSTPAPICQSREVRRPPRPHALRLFEELGDFVASRGGAGVPSPSTSSAGAEHAARSPGRRRGLPPAGLAEAAARKAASAPWWWSRSLHQPSTATPATSLFRRPAPSGRRCRAARKTSPRPRSPGELPPRLTASRPPPAALPPPPPAPADALAAEAVARSASPRPSSRAQPSAASRRSTPPSRCAPLPSSTARWRRTSGPFGFHLASTTPSAPSSTSRETRPDGATACLDRLALRLRRVHLGPGFAGATDAAGRCRRGPRAVPATRHRSPPPASPQGRRRPRPVAGFARCGPARVFAFASPTRRPLRLRSAPPSTTRRPSHVVPPLQRRTPSGAATSTSTPASTTRGRARPTSTPSPRTSPPGSCCGRGSRAGTSSRRARCATSTCRSPPPTSPRPDAPREADG